MSVKQLKGMLAKLPKGAPVYVEHEARGGTRRALGVYSSHNDYNLFLSVGWEEDARVAAGHIDLSHITEIWEVEIPAISSYRHLLYRRNA